MKEKQYIKDESSNLLPGDECVYNYSTFNDKSLAITESTTSYDLFKGLVFMLISCIFKCAFAIVCKLLLEQNPNLTPFQVLSYKAFYMFGLTIILSLYFFLINSGQLSKIFIIPKNHLNSLIGRAIMSVFSTSLTILGLKFMPISDVYAIYYIYPGIVILLSYVILKEKVGWFDYVCLASCFIGVMLIIKPTFLFQYSNTHTGNSSLIMLCVLAAALIKGTEDIILRGVGPVNCFVIPFLYSIMGMLIFPIPTLLSNTIDSPIDGVSCSDNILIICLALLTFGMQILMTLAIQNENAGRVSMVNYFQVLFMYFADIFIFNRSVVLLDLIGVGLIFVFNFINGFKKVLNRYRQLVEFKIKKQKNELLI